MEFYLFLQPLRKIWQGDESQKVHRKRTVKILKKEKDPSLPDNQSAAEGSRTPNLLIRSQMLYPIELRPHEEPSSKAQKEVIVNPQSQYSPL